MSHNCEDTKQHPTRSLLSPEEMGVRIVGGRVKINDDAATLAAVRSAENGSLEGGGGVCGMRCVAGSVARSRALMLEGSHRSLHAVNTCS